MRSPEIVREEIEKLSPRVLQRSGVRDRRMDQESLAKLGWGCGNQPFASQDVSFFSGSSQGRWLSLWTSVWFGACLLYGLPDYCQSCLTCCPKAWEKHRTPNLAQHIYPRIANDLMVSADNSPCVSGGYFLTASYLCRCPVSWIRKRNRHQRALTSPSLGFYLVRLGPSPLSKQIL